MTTAFPIARFARVPLAVLVGTTIVVGVGYLYPTGARVGLVASAAGVIAVWVWVHRLLDGAGRPRVYWPEVLLVLTLYLLGIGASTIGNQLYRIHHGEVVSVRLVEIGETPARRGGTQYSYRIERTSDGRDLGTIPNAIHGGSRKQQVGDVFDVLVDRTGRVAPSQLPTRFGFALGALIAGGVAFSMHWVCVMRYYRHRWPNLDRALATEPSPPDRHRTRSAARQAALRSARARTTRSRSARRRPRRPPR